MKDSVLSLTDLQHKHSREIMQVSTKAHSTNHSVNVVAEFSGEYVVKSKIVA
jgi:hypothetical protein